MIETTTGCGWRVAPGTGRARAWTGSSCPRADEHLGEYVPASAERLAWLTGFTGSAGLAVVLADKAAVFTDGRYVLQLAAQTDADLWERRHITEEPPPAWLAANAPTGAKIGYDPLLISEEGLARYTEAGLAMQPVSAQSDRCGLDRPARRRRSHPPCRIRWSTPGAVPTEKREQIAGLLREARQDAAVLSDPASIAWLLNIRGGDVPFTPFALGFALAHADGGTELFMDPAKLPDATRAWLGNTVSVAGRDALGPALARLAGKRVRVDASGSPVWFAQKLREAGADRRRRPGSLPAAEGLQERRRAAGRPQRPCARRGGGVPVPALPGRSRSRSAAKPRCPRRPSCSRCARQVAGLPRRELSRRSRAPASMAPSSTTA